MSLQRLELAPGYDDGRAFCMQATRDHLAHVVLAGGAENQRHFRFESAHFLLHVLMPISCRPVNARGGGANN
jgi:hypothetical protein